jgi:hypothetical protein
VTEYVRYTERRAITRPFTPSDSEHSLYEAVSGFLQRPNSYALPQRQRHLTALILRKLLASSSLAIAGTLDTLRARLETLRDEQVKDDPDFAERLIESEEIEDELLDEILADEIEGGSETEVAPIDRLKLKEEIEKKASPPMEKAAEALAQGAQKPGERSEKLAEAQKQQEEALAALRDAAKKMNTQNENLYARNFYNRLKAAATAEMKISDGLKALAKDTVGLKPEEIAEGKKSEFL